MYTVLKLFQLFEGNLKADVAFSENEFDTPVLAEVTFGFSPQRFLKTLGYRVR